MVEELGLMEKDCRDIKKLPTTGKNSMGAGRFQNFV